jgi:hypothetical protein
MLHRPGLPDPCQRQVVNSYAMGIVDIGACAVQFVNRARDQNARRIAALDHYVEGWAEADVDKIFDATAPSYRFTDPLVGSFSGRLLHEYFDILQCRFPCRNDYKARACLLSPRSFGGAVQWQGPSVLA